MSFNIDQSRILYGLGAALGVISILYFWWEVIFDLSPTVKSLLLVIGTAGFLVIGEYVGHRGLNISTYLFASFSYISFLFYTVARFSLGENQIFMMLAVSSGLFIALGYLKSTKEYSLDRDIAKYVLVVLIGLVAVLVAFDLLSPQAEYEVNYKDTVELSEGEDYSLGTLEVRNDFMFSRNVQTPRFRGCIGGLERYSISIRPDINDLISGNSVETAELESTLNIPRHENISFEDGEYEIEEGECPGNPEEGTVYVHETDNLAVPVH